MYKFGLNKRLQEIRDYGESKRQKNSRYYVVSAD